MSWYPKEQSNPITNMVCELNGYLGGYYFTTMIESGNGVCLYRLNLTNFGASKKKYGFLVPDGALTYEAMYNYLCGLLSGYKAACLKN